MQDQADGEFSRVKDKLKIHLQRHQANEDYLEVTDSASYAEFGRQFLEKPGSRSGIERRTFHDLKDEVKSAKLKKILLIDCRCMELRH